MKNATDLAINQIHSCDCCVCCQTSYLLQKKLYSYYGHHLAFLQACTGIVNSADASVLRTMYSFHLATGGCYISSLSGPTIKSLEPSFSVESLLDVLISLSGRVMGSRTQQKNIYSESVTKHSSNSILNDHAGCINIYCD